MSRTTIFDLYKQRNNPSRDIIRINQLINDKSFASTDYTGDYSIYYFAKRGFLNWKNRGRCINLEDYLETIDIKELRASATKNENDLIIYIELAYNIYYLAENYLCNCETEYYCGSQIDRLCAILDDILSEMNQRAYYDPETEQCLIGEDSPQVTAAVEATEPEVASLILRYNYRRLIGDVAQKKVILVQLGYEIMGKESELRANNQSNLFESITKALNNLDLRHNNTSRGSNDYKEQVAQLSDEELEKWYDETYQLILYAILILENIERKKRMDQFIKQLGKQKRDIVPEEA